MAITRDDPEFNVQNVISIKLSKLAAMHIWRRTNTSGQYFQIKLKRFYLI